MRLSMASPWGILVLMPLFLAVKGVNAQGCPAGYYCPSGSASSATICPSGYFCPADSTNLTTCNFNVLLSQFPNLVLPTAGNDPQTVAMNVYILGQPLAGNDCIGEGYISPISSCDSGYYCPNPATAIVCPEGWYCKDGSAQPRACSDFSKCPEGSSSPGTLVNAIIGICILLFVLYVGYAAVYAAVRMRTRQVNTSRDKRERLAIAVAPLLGKKYDHKGAHLALFKKIRPRISIRFEELGLKLRDGSSVLSGVTGEFKHSKLFAVMGPSGAGKSTFFNALTGSASGYGTISGKVYINDQESSLSKYSDVMGFVPQDDIVHEDLTVLENLVCSAYIRLPSDTPHKTCYALADAVIDLLGIRHVGNSVVGSVEKRGISGGQRKRVNIGMELVSRPSICFMDEPTSGLDSTATLEVLAALKSLTSCGMNIAAVIHQPRYSVFILFDELLLLGKGGVTVFMGPTEQMLPYFNQLNFTIPENENPADFMLDVCSGTIKREGHPGFKPSDMFDLWLSTGRAFVNSASQQQLAQQFSLQRDTLLSQGLIGLPERLELIRGALEEVHRDQINDPDMTAAINLTNVTLGVTQMKYFLEMMVMESVAEEDVKTVMATIAKDHPECVTGQEVYDFLTSADQKMGLTKELTFTLDGEDGEGQDKGCGYFTKAACCLVSDTGNRVKPGAISVMCVLIIRTLVKKARNWPNMIVNLFLILFSGAIAGILTTSSYQPVAFIAIVLQTLLIFSMIMVVCSMSVFVADRVVLIRETKTGVNTLSCFLALNFVHLIDIFLLPLLFISFWYGFVFPQVSFRTIYLATLMTSWYSSGIAYLAGVLFSSTNAVVAGAAFVLIMNAFVNGVTPPTNPSDSGSQYRFLGGFMKFLVGCSSNRWAVEIGTIGEFEEYPSYQQPQLHSYLASVGMCGTSGYPTYYDTRTFKQPYLDDTLNTVTLSQMDTATICNDGHYMMWDFLALLLQGFAWRIFAYVIFWFKLRPEVDGPYSATKKLFARMWARVRIPTFKKKAYEAPAPTELASAPANGNGHAAAPTGPNSV